MNPPSEVLLEGDTRDIAGWIWHNLAPKSGQAKTIQGELLRAVEKLCWEAQNNGNGNWDTGFEALVDYLDSVLAKELKLAEEMRASVARDLIRLRDFDHPYLEEDLYDRLTEAVVAYCRAYPDLIAKPHNENLHR